MNVIKNLRKKKNAAKRNIILLIISLFCAVAAWFIVAMTQYAAETKTVGNIPLVVDMSGTLAAENGLKPISQVPDHVKVTFDCSRTDYNRLTAETLRAYLDFSSVSTAGKKTLSVKVESTNGVDFTNYRVTPQTVTVELDEFRSAVFPIKPKHPNIIPAEDRMLGENSKCNPEEITITGPASKLARIAECFAVTDKEMKLDSSVVGINSSSFQLYDAEGTEIDQDYISFEPTIVGIDIPVLTQKTVTLKPNISVPPKSNFDTDFISFTITPPEIILASKNSEINLDDKKDIKINLRDLDIGYSKEVSVSSLLPSDDIMNVSGIESVIVKLNDENLASREMTLSNSNIDLMNVPNDDYDYTIRTERLPIKIVGPKDVINDITAADLDVEVDLATADTSMDQFRYDVVIFCKTHNNVWSVNDSKIDSKVVIEKTPKNGAAKQAARNN